MKRSVYSAVPNQPVGGSRRCFDMGSFGTLPEAINTTPVEILRLEEHSCGHEVLLDILNTFSTTLKVVQFVKVFIYDSLFQWDRVLETLVGFNLEDLVLENITYGTGKGLMAMSDDVAWTGKDLIRNGLQSMIDDFQEEPEVSGGSVDEEESDESEGLEEEDSGDGEELDELEDQGEEDV